MGFKVTQKLNIGTAFDLDQDNSNSRLEDGVDDDPTIVNVEDPLA